MRKTIELRRLDRIKEEAEPTRRGRPLEVRMLRPDMFNVASLLRALLRDEEGNPNWRRFASIIPDYLPPNAPAGERPRCVIRLKYQLMVTYLRHSRGPRQGHFWDIYGDDYQNPELALLALLETEPPRWLVCNTDKLLDAQSPDITYEV